jgi:SAM-dependent methyltransferase
MSSDRPGGRGVRISKAELEQVFRLRYGTPGQTGWGPRARHRVGYHTPDEFYEAVVAQLVSDGCSWLDVGCGRDLLPGNRTLAEALARRCGLLVGLDPDDTLDENPFVHRRVKSTLQDFRGDRAFDVVTMRMVAEHIRDPGPAIRSLARLTGAGSKLVVYTVHRWSPAAVAAWLIPFRYHHPIKRFLWGTDDRDTFPVWYRMNTRRRLATLLGGHGFSELSFWSLADCRISARFRALHRLELGLWRGLRALGVGYPESCLMGVYERQ